MTVLAVPLIEDDLDRVLSNCWETSKRELRRFGIQDPMAVESVLANRPPEQAYALKVGDEPIAVFGVWRDDEARYSTWFVGTPAFERHGAAATLVIGQLFRAELKKHPGATVFLTTTVDTSEARRWFGLLGFAEIGRTAPFVKWGRVAASAAAA